MKIDQVALQLYTLREHCQTAAALAATARRVRAIGYQAVQLSGAGPIPEAEIVAIMAGEGLTICATHEPSARILDEPEQVITRLEKLGCALTAYPTPSGFDLTDRTQVDVLVRKLDRAGARLRAAGFTLGYHNHAGEFVKLGERTALEHIYARTDPENLVGELDTYWCHFGGGDVVDWCHRLRGRLPFIHLKDYCYDGKQQRPDLCEIGAGNLDFKRIVAAAETSGCRWFIVEQDHTPSDPFISIQQSFSYLEANLVS
jgi:sugar phosphate isomerase/epimerase